jgi:hypothetical protein
MLLLRSQIEALPGKATRLQESRGLIQRKKHWAGAAACRIACCGQRCVITMLYAHVMGMTCETCTPSISCAAHRSIAVHTYRHFMLLQRHATYAPLRRFATAPRPKMQDHPRPDPTPSGTMQATIPNDHTHHDTVHILHAASTPSSAPYVACLSELPAAACGPSGGLYRTKCQQDACGSINRVCLLVGIQLHRASSYGPSLAASAARPSLSGHPLRWTAGQPQDRHMLRRLPANLYRTMRLAPHSSIIISSSPALKGLRYTPAMITSHMPTWPWTCQSPASCELPGPGASTTRSTTHAQKCYMQAERESFIHAQSIHGSPCLPLPWPPHPIHIHHALVPAHVAMCTAPGAARAKQQHPGVASKSKARPCAKLRQPQLPHARSQPHTEAAAGGATCCAAGHNSSVQCYATSQGDVLGNTAGWRGGGGINSLCARRRRRPAPSRQQRSNRPLCIPPAGAGNEQGRRLRAMPGHNPVRVPELSRSIPNKKTLHIAWLYTLAGAPAAGPLRRSGPALRAHRQCTVHCHPAPHTQDSLGSGTGMHPPPVHSAHPARPGTTYLLSTPGQASHDARPESCSCRYNKPHALVRSAPRSHPLGQPGSSRRRPPAACACARLCFTAACTLGWPSHLATGPSWAHMPAA